MNTTLEIAILLIEFVNSKVKSDFGEHHLND